MTNSLYMGKVRQLSQDFSTSQQIVIFQVMAESFLRYVLQKILHVFVFTITVEIQEPVLCNYRQCFSGNFYE